MAAAVAALLCLSSCGDSQDTAMERLLSEEYAYTVEDFHRAAAAGDLEAVASFHEAGMLVDVQDRRGFTALIRASETGRGDVIDFLLEKNADARVINEDGRTALIAAADAGHTSVVRRLMEAKSDPMVKDREGWSALTLAAFNGHAGPVEVLSGRSKDLLDDALLVACFQGNPEVIDQLLAHGAYVNTRSPANQTPLMIAAENGHLDAAKLLIQNGANPYAVDDQETTAAGLAANSGHAEIESYLDQPFHKPDKPGTTITGARSEVAAGLETALDEFTQLELSGEGSGIVGDDPLSHQLLADGRVAKEESPVKSIQGALIRVPEVEGGEPESQPATSAAAEPSETAAVVAAPSEPSTRHHQATGVATAAPSSVEAAGMKSETTVASASGPDAPSHSPAGSGSLATTTDLPDTAVTANDASSSSSAPVSAAQSSSPIRSFVMEGYRETPLPIMLKEVQKDQTAQVRILRGNHPESVPVKEGEMIGETPFRLLKVNTKFVSSKQGKGKLVDVSRILIEDIKTGDKHMLVKDVPGKSSEIYAVLTVKDSPYRYVVRPDDQFTTDGANGRRTDYRVIDVRPTQVVIEALDSREVYTIERQGLVMN